MERMTRHHVFSERAWYRTKTEKTFRTIGGLVVPMVCEWHNRTPDSLHNNVGHPPKPTRDMILDILNLDLPQNHLLAVEQVAGRFALMATRASLEYDHNVALGIHDNLMQQMPYLMGGYIDRGLVLR